MAWSVGSKRTLSVSSSPAQPVQLNRPGSRKLIAWLIAARAHFDLKCGRASTSKAKVTDCTPSISGLSRGTLGALVTDHWRRSHEETAFLPRLLN